MNIRKITHRFSNRSPIAALLLITLFAGCSGGGSSGGAEPTTHPVSSSSEVSLGTSGAKLNFPEGSLPANTRVSVKEVTPPPLTGQITAVGKAFQVDMNNQPTKPVKITLPIPAGEDPADLMLMRLEDSGRITLLQTELEGGMLTALTPGFSRVSAVRLEELPADFSPLISGPEILPLNIAGQYSEQTLSAVIGVQSQWRLIEEAPHTLEHNNRQGTAKLAIEKAGLYTLMVEFTEPTTGLNVVAFKSISVLPTLEAGEELDITAYGPAIITQGKPFNLSAVVLNTDVTEMSRWNWTLGNRSGSCESECSIRFDLNEQQLNAAGVTRFTVTGFSASGVSGTASLDIKVLADDMSLHLSQQPDNENITIAPSSPPIEITLSIQVEGGTAPYTYEWFYNDANSDWGNSKATELSWDAANSFTFFLDQPGSYQYRVNVTDDNGQFSWRYGYFALQGALPVEFAFENLPTEPVTANQSTTITLTAKGGVLAFNGYQYESYDYLIDWDDGTIDTGQIPATNPFDGGSIELSHTYTAPDAYTVQYVASPTRSADFLNFNLSPFEEATIEVTAASNRTYPTMAICPTIHNGLTDEDYSPVLISHGDYGQSTCNYSLGNSRPKIDINYGDEVSAGCNVAPDSRYIQIAEGVIYDRYFASTAMSTQRTISATYNNAPGVANSFEDIQTALIAVLKAAVSQPIGEACP